MNKQSPKTCWFFEKKFIFGKIANFHKTVVTGVSEFGDCKFNIRFSNFKIVDPIWRTSNRKFY